MAAEFMPQHALAVPTGTAPAREAGMQPILDDVALLSPAGSNEGRATRGVAAPAAAMQTAAMTAATASLTLQDALHAASRSGQQAAEQAEGAALDVPAGAGATGQLANSVQPLTHIGVGEAGWGCAAAGQAFHGCKWAARAGVVLQMPDHARLAAAAAAHRGAAVPAGHAAAEGGTSAAFVTQPAGECAQGASSEPCGQQQASLGAQPSQGNTPVFLFRSWGMQLQGQEAALKGLQKCEWQEFGFLLDHAEAGAGGGRFVLGSLRKAGNVCWARDDKGIGARYKQFNKAEAPARPLIVLWELEQPPLSADCRLIVECSLRLTLPSMLL